VHETSRKKHANIGHRQAYKKVSRTGRMYEKVHEILKIFPNGAFCNKKLMAYKAALISIKTY
jgi:hypothetical protein